MSYSFRKKDRNWYIATTIIWVLIALFSGILIFALYHLLQPLLQSWSL